MNSLLVGFGNAIGLGFSAIVRAKVRAVLTVLGILVGVAAVVIVTALGTGVQERITAQIKSLGSNMIWVFPQPNQSSGARGARGGGGRLTENDGKAILREATSVTAVVPYMQAQAQVVVADRNIATTVAGSTRAYVDVRGFTIAAGANFTETDERMKAKVCLLGQTAKENLFGNQDAVGQVVRIGRYPFRVVGVLARKGQTPGGEDQDDRVVMPVGTFRARVSPTAPGRVHVLLVSASDGRTVNRAIGQVDSILRQRHGIEPDKEPDFGIRSQAEFLKTQEEILGTLKALLIGIAMVALGVGGIGVMNIMLVSVTERTREIGIRMAIGARAGQVVRLVLRSTSWATASGLVLGLAGAVLVSRALDGFTDGIGPFDTVTFASVVTILALAALGATAGPVRRAPRVAPATALRAE